MMMPGYSGVLSGVVASVGNQLSYRLMDVGNHPTIDRQPGDSREEALSGAIYRVGAQGVTHFRNQVSVAQDHDIGGRSAGRNLSQFATEHSHLVLLKIPSALVVSGEGEGRLQFLWIKARVGGALFLPTHAGGRKILRMA